MPETQLNAQKKADGNMIETFKRVRRWTEEIVEPLEIEDFVLQSMADVSPPKWHMAHTTWFFERFILKQFVSSYNWFHPTFDHLFNSYYVTVGHPFPREQRGLLSRPTVQEVWAYRRHVEQAVLDLLAKADSELQEELYMILELGLHHEQQHQELLLTDIKHNLSINPLQPSYHQPEQAEHHGSMFSKHRETDRREIPDQQTTPALQWKEYEGGLVTIGHHGYGFSFDNETPQHKVWLYPFAMANRPVTNGEFIDFIEEGGYENPAYWLSDGWNKVIEEGWKAPLYWQKTNYAWETFTMEGVQPVQETEPVCHVSYYEADAYASWAGFRLPTEFEWEHAFRDMNKSGHFLQTSHFHPSGRYGKAFDQPLEKGFGDVWEWTMSPYAPYPGHQPLDGALGEYNAKFMSNQMVLRGGSCVTPADHIRLTYRNFFQPEKRWQFSGLRLAVDGA